MLRFCLTLSFLILLYLQAWGQALLQSGPMTGYSTMQEVMLWVQTHGPATVQFRYWRDDEPKRVFTTSPVQTKATHAFAVHAVADSVEPGQKYSYQLILNQEPVEVPYPLRFQTQSLWQWRTDPPAFTFALGSCAYFNDPPYDRPGTPYGGEYEIFETIARMEPDFMLWLGDNVYYREADWNSRTGMLHRYTHDRSTAELQPLLGGVHHYAIWDDHDYGPNNSDRSFWNKQEALDIFKLFWANPNYELAGVGGITGTFHWHDVQFFLMDNRWFRAPNDLKESGKDYLGESQLQWLLDALHFSQASFKIIVVGGQVINDAATGENYAAYPEERERLLQAIQEAGIEGVLFLSGDRHHTELSAYTEGHYPLYDLTVSPLTSGIHTPENEKNTWQIPGTLVADRNFAIVRASGPLGQRVLYISILDTEGKVLWEKGISQEELKK